MAWWMAVAAVASTVAKNDADQKATRAQSKSLDAAARDKLKAADSLIYASTINRTLAEQRGRQVQSDQVTSYASAGVDITSGSVLSTIAETESQILKNDFLSKHKADAEADLLRSQAGQLQEQSRLAGENSKARQTQNLIMGGLDAYSKGTP